MATHTKKELLEWLAIKPRTEGWGAVVSYNRNKCNELLAQDYINKFTSDSYMDPINKPVPTGDANWEHLIDWVTDWPRLSFEDSSKTAGGEVRMTMAVVGGGQVAIDNALGHKRAIAIKSLDALDHPELIAEEVALSKTSGTVGKDTGEVVLDLGDPVTAKGNWELSFANTLHERRQGGAFFKKHFRETDREKRIYRLGKIAYTDQQYLKPQSFILRTLTAPGAASRGSSNFGDGVVELFVRMEGDAEGGMPPRDDWKSLIPDDGAGGYDCALLLSNKLLMEKIIYAGVRRSAYPMPAGSDFLQSDTYSPGFIKLTAKPGLSYIRVPGGLYVGEDYTIQANPVNPDLLIASVNPLSVRTSAHEVENECILLEFAGRGRDVNQYQYVLRNIGGSGPLPQNVILHWRYKTNIKIGINQQSGALAFEQAGEPEADAGVENAGVTDARVVRDFVAINNEVRQSILFGLRGPIHNVFFALKDIDVFVLNSILFSNHELVKPKEVKVPGDLALFGQISSPFAITPQDHLMGHGATHTFKVSPEFTGTVKWSVKAVPGSKGSFGAINPDTGVYTSPAIGAIDGTFVRAIVTATDTASTFSSSSLVTVVVRDITVNPVVQICNASPVSGAPITRTLSANTLGEGILEWRVKKGDGSIPLRAGPDGKNTYTAGPKNNDLEGTFAVDEVEVKNLATGKTQTAYVVVNHIPQDLIMVVDLEQSSFPTGKAKLKVTDKRDRPVTVELEVVAGNGSVDSSSGMYTSDPSSPHRFALVKATKDNDNEDDCWILLTYPLIELPDKPVDNLSDY